MADLTNLTIQVDRAVALGGQAVTLLQNQAPDQQPEIDVLTGKLVASNDALDAAVNPTP